jgi:hypothetical protein
MSISKDIQIINHQGNKNGNNETPFKPIRMVIINVLKER